MENNETFEYTYSAAQQAEIEKIRRKYLPVRESKMEQICRLDRSTSQKAQIAAMTLGIIGALVMGTGMSLAMTDLGAVLGDMAMVLGILIGTAGMVLAALAYPVYHKILRKERERIAPEILRLTEELMQ